MWLLVKPEGLQAVSLSLEWVWDINVKGHLNSPWFQGINPREICCKQGQKPQYQMQFRWAAAVSVFRFVTVTVQLQPLLPPLLLSHKDHAEMS